MRNHRISKACLLFTVVLITGACGSRRPQPLPPATAAKDTGEVRLKLGVENVRENDEGELCALLCVFNDSDFPIMLRLPDGGAPYEVTKEEGSYDDAMAGKGHYGVHTIGQGGSDMKLATEYVLLAGRARPGVYPVDSVCYMNVVLVRAPEYTEEKALYDKQGLYQKFRNRIKAQLSLRLDYLQSCAGVLGCNADPIREGTYHYVELKKEVVIVPAAVAPKKP